jgi:hypothetical protein
MLDWPLGTPQRRPYPATLLFYITIQHFGMASFHSFIRDTQRFHHERPLTDTIFSHHTKAFSLYERHHEPKHIPPYASLSAEDSERLRKRFATNGADEVVERGADSFHHGKGESEARRRAMSMRMTKRSFYIHLNVRF